MASLFLVIKFKHPKLISANRFLSGASVYKKKHCFYIIFFKKILKLLKLGYFFRS